jgi:hypothetical protein
LDVWFYNYVAPTALAAAVDLEDQRPAGWCGRPVFHRPANYAKKMPKKDLPISKPLLISTM